MPADAGTQPLLLRGQYHTYCLVDGYYHVNIRGSRAILATILTQSTYQRTVAWKSAITPAAPRRNPPTQDVSPLL